MARQVGESFVKVTKEVGRISSQEERSISQLEG